MGLSKISFSLPDWLDGVLEEGRMYATVEERMTFVVSLSRLNVERDTGGPFAAGIFDCDTHELLAPGVNMVVPARCSMLHAEVVAIMTAQQKAGTHDLGGDGMSAYEIVSSTEPCAMCMGAIPWAGVRKLVCGARGDDACAIGMDEGAKPDNWVELFELRGIAVTRDVCREQAAAVLRDYAAGGGLIYNGRSEESTTGVRNS